MKGLSSRLPELFDLTDQVAIVTGGGRGIGRATALRLAEFGANVVVVDINEDSARKVAKEVENLGREALAIEADVSRMADAKDAIEQTMKRFGKIDILVNNAGILGPSRDEATVKTITEKDWRKIMSINLDGVLFFSKAVIGHMTKRGKGRIINIGSSLSSKASVKNEVYGNPAYTTSKAAVQCLTKHTAYELAPRGINVNAVAPGMVLTPMHEGYLDELQRTQNPLIPLCRCAEPEDIANAILFLASKASDYITGQTIHVNGGQIMVD